MVFEEGLKEVCSWTIERRISGFSLNKMPKLRLNLETPLLWTINLVILGLSFVKNNFWKTLLWKEELCRVIWAWGVFVKIWKMKITEKSVNFWFSIFGAFENKQSFIYSIMSDQCPAESWKFRISFCLFSVPLAI